MVESTSITVGVGSAVGNTVGTESSIAITTGGGIGVGVGVGSKVTFSVHRSARKR